VRQRPLSLGPGTDRSRRWSPQACEVVRCQLKSWSTNGLCAVFNHGCFIPARRH